MLKLKEGSPAFSIMNMSGPQFPRGNKLFLPKIEYAKLANAQSFNGEKPNIKNTISAREKSNGELEAGEKVPLLNNEYNMGSFTRFSVLPPINDSVCNARRLSRARRFSSGVRFTSANGPSSASSHEVTNKQGDDNKLYKYPGFTSTVPQQQRNSNNEHVQSLQVVGKPYARDKLKTRHSSQGKSNARSPRRSFSSPMPSEGSDSNCKGCQILLTRERSKTEGAKLGGKLERLKTDRAVHTCNKSETLTGHVLKRFNSENLDLLNESCVYEKNNGNKPLRSPKKSSQTELRSNLLTADLVPVGRRPVSRCEISLDVNEGNQQLQVPTETQKVNSQKQNIPPPLIQIETDELTTQDEPFSQGTPQIQILIDSLDSAKEELPKPNREVPYTSVREQRRRSALCRNNSKQVDDFLLVHNLRDLGLL